jgi:transposase
MNDAIGRNLKKEFACELYIRGLTQKEIAAKIDVSERTMSLWVNKGNWDVMRKSQLITKQKILADYYEQLEEVCNHIKQKPEGQRYADNKTADIQMKITAAIKSLETELGISDVVDVSIRILKWLRGIEPDKAKELSGVFDAFIQSLAKN